MPKHIIYDEQIELPVYIHMPACLIESELTAEERMVYAAIYNRALLSVKNTPDYVNEDKQVYVIYTNDGLAQDSGLKLGKLKKAKASLSEKQYIRIEKIQKSHSVRIYPMIPDNAITYRYHVSHLPQKGESAPEDYQAQSFNVCDFFVAAVEKTESEI